MPNIKSAKKRVKVIETKTLKNNIQKSELKTTIKKAKQAIEAGVEAAGSALVSAIKSIDQAVSKGLLHKNTAARKKSSLQKKSNKSSAK